MKLSIQKLLSLALSAAMLLCMLPMQASAASDEVAIILSDSGTTVDGAAISTDASAAVYEGADIVYYPEGYDETFGDGTADEMHSAETAAAQTVVTITQAGTYRVSGTLSAGQLAIDLGEDAADDTAAVVTLILDNVSITCDIAPAVIFYNVYECSSSDIETATANVDTSAAGANVIIADGSVNNITGGHVAKIFKTDTTPKIKYDGAFYSVMSMNIDGESAGTGVLNIVADNEGLDSELHLTINGGNIYIYAQDDGINTNEDYVSVTTINGGNLHICGGLGAEGDGIDSNGWLVINGGTVIATANPASDSGLDADNGVYVNGGTVVGLGSTMDWADADSEQVTLNLQFASMQNQDEAIVVTDTEGNIVFAYDPDQDEVTGSNLRNYQGAIVSFAGLTVGETYNVYLGGTIVGTDVMGIYDVASISSYTGGVQQMYTGTDVGRIFGGTGGMMGEMPEGMEMGERPEIPEGMEMGEMSEGAEQGERPEMSEGMEQGERPEMPEGMEMGEMPEMTEGQAPNMSGGNAGSTAATASASVYFYMTDTVNAFSGVTDYDEAVLNASNQVFEDVTSDDWFYQSVMYCVQNGLMNGTSDTTFEPGVQLSRGMMVTLLYRLAGSPAVSGEASFADVEADAWYSDAVLWAAENGIVTGYSNGNFGTNDAITREDMVTMLYRYAQQFDYDLSANDSLESFDDNASVNSYALDAMQWAVGAGVVQGADGALSPKTTAQRSQIATILERVNELF